MKKTLIFIILFFTFFQFPLQAHKQTQSLHDLYEQGCSNEIDLDSYWNSLEPAIEEGDPMPVLMQDQIRPTTSLEALEYMQREIHDIILFVVKVIAAMIVILLTFWLITYIVNFIRKNATPSHTKVNYANIPMLEYSQKEEKRVRALYEDAPDEKENFIAFCHWCLKKFNEKFPYEHNFQGEFKNYIRWGYIDSLPAFERYVKCFEKQIELRYEFDDDTTELTTTEAPYISEIPHATSKKLTDPDLSIRTSDNNNNKTIEVKEFPYPDAPVRYITEDDSKETIEEFVVWCIRTIKEKFGTSSVFFNSVILSLKYGYIRTVESLDREIKRVAVSEIIKNKVEQSLSEIEKISQAEKTRYTNEEKSDWPDIPNCEPSDNETEEIDFTENNSEEDPFSDFKDYEKL